MCPVVEAKFTEPYFLYLRGEIKTGTMDKRRAYLGSELGGQGGGDTHDAAQLAITQF